MQRDDKLLDMTLDAILARIKDLRTSIMEMLVKIDHERNNLDWPTFLDSFALIASQLSSLQKTLPKENCPQIRNRTVLPLLLSRERDDHLFNITQGRVPAFSHDIVPHYLRTKPLPITEQKMLQNEQKAANVSNEAAMKQIAHFNKIISHTMEIVAKARDEWDMETSSRTGIQQTCSMSDSQLLVTAVGCGTGLRMQLPPMPGPGGPNMMVPPQMRGAAPMAGAPGGVGPMGKVPSAVKTNIKSAMQVHPFQRK